MFLVCVSDNGIGVEGGQAIASALEKNTTLTSVNLGGEWSLFMRGGVVE